MILITGGMGFIGMHTARKLLDAGESVVSGINAARREPDMLKDEIDKRLFVERVDVTNPVAVLEAVHKHTVTGIVHLVNPRLFSVSPGEEARINMNGLINILEAARVYGIKRVCIASSAAVYAKVPEGPFREEDPLPMESGNSVDAFKKIFEVLALHYGDRAGIETILMRISGVYGPLYYSGFLGYGRICHAAAEGTPVDFSGVLGGIPYEDGAGDLTYVKDVGKAIQMLQTAEHLSHRVYNIGSGQPSTFGEFVAAARELAPDLEVPLQPGSRPGSKPNPFMDLSRIKSDVGFAPEYSLEGGVREYVEWLRQNPQ